MRRNRPALPRCGQGFTLIELLVVIAIIVALAAILFPTFSRVRYLALEKSDFSNMRQICRAFQLYTLDWSPDEVGRLWGNDQADGSVPQGGGQPQPTIRAFGFNLDPIELQPYIAVVKGGGSTAILHSPFDDRPADADGFRPPSYTIIPWPQDNEWGLMVTHDWALDLQLFPELSRPDGWKTGVEIPVFFSLPGGEPVFRRMNPGEECQFINCSGYG